MERLAGLDNLVQLAIDEEVNFVIIAGDLYDGNWRDHNTGLFFVSRVVKLREAGIPVFVISGNHDAASKMTRSLRMPTNPDGTKVMLSDRRPKRSARWAGCSNPRTRVCQAAINEDT